MITLLAPKCLVLALGAMIAAATGARAEDTSAACHDAGS